MIQTVFSRLLIFVFFFAWIPAALAAPGPGGEVQVFQLPSGHTVYVKENHNQPIVTIDTWVKTGSVNETTENNGVSHFLEHLIFKGTEKHKAGEFEQLMGAKGAEYNAATSDDFTHYYITIASPFFEKALALQGDMVTNAVIPPEELTAERKVVQEEINRALDNPQRQLFIEMSQRLYGEHGYALDTLGPKELIGTIPREKILDYYHYWYRPEHFNTVIVGDVDAKKAVKLVEKYFSGNPNSLQTGNYAPPMVKSVQPVKSASVKVLEDPSINQAYIALGFLAPGVEQRDESHALDVGTLILGAGKSSRLYQQLREEQSLVTTVSASNYTQQHGGLAFIYAAVPADKLAQARGEMLRIIEKIKTNGITQGELDKAKTQTIKDFIFLDETTDGVAQNIGYNVTIGTLEDYSEYVGDIQKVTAADAQRALQKYLDFDKAILIELLPKGTIASTGEEEKQLLAELSAATSGTVAQQETGSKKMADIQKQLLTNGMTLVTKPLKGSETVALKIFVKGGQMAEPIPGISPLTASLLSKKTATRTAEKLNRELESRGMDISISSHEDFVQIDANAVAGDLGELFMVLQDILKNPAFDEEALSQEKDLLKQALKISRDNPSAVALENLTTTLYYPYHPYGNIGKRIEVHLDKIQPENIRTFFNDYFIPRNMVVTAVGNFSPVTLASYLESTFPESINARSDKPDPLADTQEADTLISRCGGFPCTNVVTRKNLSATAIARGWLGPEIAGKDYAAMKVINSLLGMGMDSRLFRNLREKQGLAYVVTSLYPSTKGPGRFVIYIGTDPKNKDAVLKGFNREIRNLQTRLVPAAELQNAKDKLTGAFALSHETNNNQAYYLGFYETLGVGYGFDDDFPKLIQSVTAQDLKRAARTWFGQSPVTSLVVPE